MSKFYQIATKRNKSWEYNRESIKHLLDMLDEGQYLISIQPLNPQSQIKEYRRCYFAKIEALGREVGEGKHSMHELVKEYVLGPMLEELPTLTSGNVVSTKHLLLNGWIVLLERLDLWAFMEYGTVLK